MGRGDGGEGYGFWLHVLMSDEKERGKVGRSEQSNLHFCFMSKELVLGQVWHVRIK